VQEDERYDGKYVLMTNELELDAKELVLGYRDMGRAERAFRSMKSVLHIEPVHHRQERGILVHAHLCVLADLLTRIAENRTEESWPLLREKLEPVSVGRIETDHATIMRVKRLKDSESKTWNCCRLELPPRTLQVPV
jgi:transposase